MNIGVNFCSLLIKSKLRLFWLIFRSGSVSRGLQVEEDDLIQFSESQGKKSKRLKKLRNPSAGDLEDVQEQEDGGGVKTFINVVCP